MGHNRIEWIDTAKGIGIILVVFGHLQSHIAHNYLYTFLMPLFFFISGQTTKELKGIDGKLYLKNQVLKLMYPYFLWGGLLLMFWLIFDSSEGSSNKNIIGLFIGTGGSRYMDWGVMFWFLPSLLVTKLMYYVINKNVAVIKFTLIVMVTLIGFLLGYFEVLLPFSAHASLVLIFFYYLGYQFKGKIRLNKIGVFIVSGFLWLIVIELNGDVATYIGKYGNPLLFMVGAVLGVLCIVSLSQLVSNVKVLKDIGENSLIIFMLHLRAITFVKAIQLYLLKIPIQDAFFDSAIYTLIAILLLLPFSNLIKRSFPMLIKYEKIKTV